MTHVREELTFGTIRLIRYLYRHLHLGHHLLCRLMLPALRQITDRHNVGGGVDSLRSRNREFGVEGGAVETSCHPLINEPGGVLTVLRQQLRGVVEQGPQRTPNSISEEGVGAHIGTRYGSVSVDDQQRIGTRIEERAEGALGSRLRDKCAEELCDLLEECWELIVPRKGMGPAELDNGQDPFASHHGDGAQGSDAGAPSRFGPARITPIKALCEEVGLLAGRGGSPGDPRRADTQGPFRASSKAYGGRHVHPVATGRIGDRTCDVLERGLLRFHRPHGHGADVVRAHQFLRDGFCGLRDRSRRQELIADASRDLRMGDLNAVFRDIGEDADVAREVPSIISRGLPFNQGPVLLPRFPVVQYFEREGLARCRRARHFGGGVR